MGAPPPSDVYTHPEYPETEELDERRAASDCTCDDLEVDICVNIDLPTPPSVPHNNGGVTLGVDGI